MIRKQLIKGTYGYIDKYKKLYGLVSLGWLVLIAATFVTGLCIYKTKLNGFTVAAVLLVLPAARLWVTWIMMLPYRSCQKSEYDKISGLMDGLSGKVYADLVVTKYEGAMYLPIVVNYDDNFFAYAPKQRKSQADIRSYLNQMIKEAGSSSKAQVYEDYEKFETAVLKLSQGTNLKSSHQTAMEKQLFSAAV